MCHKNDTINITITNSQTDNKTGNWYKLYIIHAYYTYYINYIHLAYFFYKHDTNVDTLNNKQERLTQNQEFLRLHGVNLAILMANDNGYVFHIVLTYLSFLIKKYTKTKNS